MRFLQVNRGILGLRPGSKGHKLLTGIIDCNENERVFMAWHTPSPNPPFFLLFFFRQQPPE